MYEYAISNYGPALDAYLDTDSDCSGYGGCSYCPDNGQCLQLCDRELYYDDTNANCQLCQGSCGQNGCVRGTNCSLCDDDYCNICTDFDLGSCQQCTLPTVLGSSSSAGQCICSEADFKGDTYFREDYDAKCCAAGCETCSEEKEFQYCTTCQSDQYNQPDLANSGLVVCFPYCPSGYTTVSGSPGTCTEAGSDTGSGRLLIDYDLTYITSIVNLADNTILTPQLGSTRGYSDTNPYKLRGAHSSGNSSSMGIYIPDLVLHHSFSVTTWVLIMTLNTSSLLSKSTGDFSQSGSANFLYFMVDSDGSFGVEYFTSNDSNDHFGGNAYSSSGQLTTDIWYNLGFEFAFDGQSTTVTNYYNSAAQSSDSFNGIFLYEQSSSPSAWLMMAEGENNGVAVAEYQLHGYMYRFQMTTATRVSEFESDGSNCSGGSCSYCPIFNGKVCLWTGEIDQYQDSSDQTQSCDSSCTDSNGCVRIEDCNRCDDRLCSVCTNFDTGLSICTDCITNADNNNDTTVCACSTGFVFDEATDSCISCDTACTECDGEYFTDCQSCESGYFKQTDAETCLDFCPTNQTSSGSTNSCISVSNEMFDLDLSNWREDFKQIYDSVTTMPIIPGSSEDYGSDDAWLHSTRTFAFYGSQLMTIGGDGLLLANTMSITAWLYPTSGGSNRTILAKIDTGVSSPGHKLFVFYLNGNQIALSIATSNGTVANDITATDSNGQVSNDAWFQGVATFSLESRYSTTVTIYKDGTSVYTQTLSVQFNDISTSSGVIGCSLTSNGNTENFFSGYLYSLTIVNNVLSSSDVSNDNGNTAGSVPNIGNCEPYQYLDGSCQSCNQSADNTEGTVAYDNDACTICNSSKCIQCDEVECFECKTGSHIESGACVCDTSLYYTDSNNGNCEPCHQNCSDCSGPDIFPCTTCRNDGVKHPSADACVEQCPLGYVQSGNICTGAADSAYFLFATIADSWSAGSYTFNRGRTSSTESDIEPFTYKARGLYFDGVDDLVSMDNALYLDASFTLTMWFRPSVASGTLFGKSFNNFTSPSSAEFIDLRLFENLTLGINITPRFVESSKFFVTVTEQYTLNNWNIVGVSVAYTYSTPSTSVTFVMNSSASDSATSQTDFTTLDEKDSITTLGARLDGHNDNKEVVSDLFQGFIFSLKIDSEALTVSTIQSSRVASGCGTGCTSCPSETNSCLWNCDDDEYFDDSTCQTCPTCQSPHENGWAGCISGDNCNLCDGLCATCSSFDEQCSTCISNASGSPSCTCNTNYTYIISTHSCDVCDDSCEVCSDSTIYTCTTCRNGALLQTDAPFCYTFCPTGYTEAQPCSLSNSEVITVDFLEISIDLRNLSASSVEFDIGDSRPTPLKGRGHNFNGSNQFWIVDTATPLALHHSFTIAAWIKVDSFSTNHPIFSKNTDGSATLGAEDLLNFYIATDSTPTIRIADGVS